MFPHFVTERCKELPDGKKVLKLLKRLHKVPTIHNIIKLENFIQKPVLKYITGDISYEGNKNIDCYKAQEVYPYLIKFFDIDAMMKNAVNEISFWNYVLTLI